jgi:hypothetical protein
MKKPSHTIRAHRLIRQLTALAVVQVALILLVSDRVEATVFPRASGDVACLVARSTGRSRTCAFGGRREGRLVSDGR